MQRGLVNQLEKGRLSFDTCREPPRYLHAGHRHVINYSYPRSRLKWANRTACRHHVLVCLCIRNSSADLAKQMVQWNAIKKQRNSPDFRYRTIYMWKEWTPPARPNLGRFWELLFAIHAVNTSSRMCKARIPASCPHGHDERCVKIHRPEYRNTLKLDLFFG